MVDPTGLKPAPHGLKVRCSVTRAPGQQIGCGGRIRTFDSRINNPVPYQLGYATRDLHRTARGSERVKHARSAKARGSLRTLEATKGVEPLSFGLQDRRSVIQLSYIAKRIGGLGGSQILTRSLQDFYALGYITSPISLVAMGGFEPPTSRL